MMPVEKVIFEFNERNLETIDKLKRQAVYPLILERFGSAVAGRVAEVTSNSEVNPAETAATISAPEHNCCPYCGFTVCVCDRAIDDNAASRKGY